MAQRSSRKRLRCEWRIALCELAGSCAESEPDETQRCLRRMNELLMFAPEEALRNGLRAVSPSRLEALLAVGAHDTAVMAMLIKGAGYMLSRSRNGDSLATVALPGAISEKSGAGATPALALLAALALSLGSAPLVTSSARGRTSTPARAALH